MDVDRKTLSERGVRISMIARRFGNASNLATRRVALCLAEVLIEEEFGKDELPLQSPLTIVECDDRWEIEGSRIPKPIDDCPHNGLDGKVKMIIAKIDCQVLDFVRERTFPTPPLSLDELARLSPEEAAKLSDM